MGHSMGASAPPSETLPALRGRPAGLMAFTVAGGRITAIDGITDPSRVRRLVS